MNAYYKLNLPRFPPYMLPMNLLQQKRNKKYPRVLPHSTACCWVCCKEGESNKAFFPLQASVTIHPFNLQSQLALGILKEWPGYLLFQNGAALSSALYYAKRQCIYYQNSKQIIQSMGRKIKHGQNKAVAGGLYKIILMGQLSSCNFKDSLTIDNHGSFASAANSWNNKSKTKQQYETK